MMVKKDIFCQWCNLDIKRGEKVAGCHTYNSFPQVSDERYFHFDCYLEWLNTKIKDAGVSAFNKSMKKIMPMIKPIAENMAESIKSSINNEEETKKDKVLQYRIS